MVLMVRKCIWATASETSGREQAQVRPQPVLPHSPAHPILIQHSRSPLHFYLFNRTLNGKTESANAAAKARRKKVCHRHGERPESGRLAPGVLRCGERSSSVPFHISCCFLRASASKKTWWAALPLSHPTGLFHGLGCPNRT